MTNKHLLVVGVSSSGPQHRFYIERIRRAGNEITLLTPQYHSWLKDIVNTFLYCDPFNEDACVEVARACHESNPFDGILCFYEPYVKTAAKIAANLNLLGLSIEVARRCRNKYAMRNALWQHGVRIPKYALAEDYTKIPEIVQQFEYPVVLKPVEGAASIAVMRLNSDADLEVYMEKFVEIPRILNFKGEMPHSFLIEEYLDGEEACIDSFVQGDKIVPLMTCEKVLPMKGPLFLEEMYLSPPRYSKDKMEKLLECNTQAIKALGVNIGITHAEFRIVDGVPYVLEVAARPGGMPFPMMIELLTDVDLPNLMAQLVSGVSSIPTVNIKQHVALRDLFAPKTGKVLDLQGISECMDHPNIHSVTVYTKVGEQVYAPPHPKGFRPNIASVVAIGKTSLECLESLIEASTLIRPKIESVENMKH
jgi:biotin carboxylase